MTAAIQNTLLTLRTADGWDIDALLYATREVELTPPADRVALIHVHGKGGNMLRGMSRYLPELLPGYLHLSINMRCHDLATNTGRADKPNGGGMYESLADGHHDLAAAVSYLRGLGVGTVILSGHSSGGWYVGDYGSRYSDIDARFVLSPLTDNKTKLAFWFPGGVGLAEKRAEAEQLIADGRPNDLLLLPSEYWAISAAAFIERISEVDDTWLRAMQANDTPTLLAWGTAESRDQLWRDLFTQFTAPSQFAAIEGADHDFAGTEHEVADLVNRFVSDLTGVDGYAGRTPSIPAITPLEGARSLERA
jgi:pimeloyl-ACP methyl ester carboxylesterase